MKTLAVSILTPLLSALFAIGGLYFYFNSDFKTERGGRKVTATAILLFPIYGIVEFSPMIAGEAPSLIILNIASLMLFYGFWKQYKVIS